MMLNRVCQWLALIVLALFPVPARAWNALGHKTVAEIAWRQLSPEQRQQIVDILRRHPRFDKDFAAKMEDAAQGDKAMQDHWIFQNAATWPDEIRKDKEYDRPSWHYINLPVYLNPSDRGMRLPGNTSADYPTRTPLAKFNALQAIAYSRDTIQSNAAPEVKAVAYCWLLHLVGDLHQPLHCAALFSVNQFPKGDEGGNLIPLRKGKNLHALWDDLLGKQYYMRNVEKSANELEDKDRFADVWSAASTKSNPEQWAVESRDLCEADVYDPAILDAVRRSATGEKLTPIDLPVSYYKAAGELARKRVLMAGLRLAATLKVINP
jgi:hypothetical protein